MRFPALSLFAAIPLTVLAGAAAAEASDSNVAEGILANGVETNDASGLLQSIQANSTDACEAACASLLENFGGVKVASRDEPEYKATIDYFWSAQQQEPKPRCIFRPETAQEVANMMRVSQANKCKFAVRSGGHAAFAGASSADGGITVVLDRMASVTLSEDKKIASVGPGAVWSDIYDSLAEHNVSVVGGRVADVGIGGLVTGGGISFFSNQRGWACDNVMSYEVVLADGRIAVAKADSEYSDLYWALRGGGNNLGIVTRFDLEAFPHGPLMFGGNKVFVNDSFSGAIDAFVEMGLHIERDPKAAQILSFAFDARNDMRLAVAELEYADATTDAPIFESWNKVPAIADTTKINTLANLTLAMKQVNPSGFRASYWTATAKLVDREMADRIVDIAFEAFDKIKHIPGIIPAASLQAITTPQLELMQKNGGNILGLTTADGPLLLLIQTFQWNNAQDDELVLKTGAEIVAKFKQASKDLGVDHDYLYMNYASQFQDVVAGYGESADKLRRIARKYDPEGVFQTLQPGYHKLNGPQNKNWPL